MIVATLILAFTVLMLIGTPIVWSMAAATILVVFAFHLGTPMSWLAQQLLRGADVYTLEAIPLFLFAGEIMNRGGLTRRIIRVTEHFLGRIRGGLGLVNVATAFIYGGITGSATADTGAVASIMIPAMEEKGYPRAFSAAVTAASGTLGIIVPPSVVMIIYGVLTNTSIGGLFVAGVIPGAFIAGAFMITSYVIAVRNDFPRSTERAPAKVIARDILGALPAVLMPAFIIGCLVGGYATPTEAAAVAVLYALAVGIFVYRELTFRDLYPSLVNAVTTTGAIMILMAIATPFAWILTVEQVPHEAAAWIGQLDVSNLTRIALVLLVIKVVGFWLDLGPALIILAPILTPICLRAGLGDLQTGVLFTVVLGWGLFTPPVGTNIFVVCNVGKVDVWPVSVRLIPYWAATLVCVVALVLWPGLTEWLPRQFGL